MIRLDRLLAHYGVNDICSVSFANTSSYYNRDRPHMSLGEASPVTRDVELPIAGKIIALPRVGGLHHRYSRAA